MPVLDQNNKQAVQAYQTFVNTSPFGQITQNIAWQAVKENWEGLYVYVEEAGRIIAAASILIGQGPEGSRFAYCTKGPVMDMQDISLFNQLVTECKKALPEDVYLLKFDPEIKYDEELIQFLTDAGYVILSRNIEALGMHGTIQPRLNMVIHFDQCETRPTSLHDLVPSKIKNKLKKAVKDGVEVTYGNGVEELEAFYISYETMSKRHGISYRPKFYFEQMQKAFPGTEQMRIYLAKKEGELLSTGVAFKAGDKIWYMYAGSMDTLLYNAPYAVQEAMVQWAIDANCARYDMGGIEAESTEDGLYTFKRNFVREGAVEYLGEIDVVLDQKLYDKVYQEKYSQ